MTMQWHPLFAQLLRPLVEDYYEVLIDMPVGDAPRKADLVLLRRLPGKPPPFRGLWRNLTLWSILEYKGPTVSARLADLDLLVELGLGIHRRLNEQGGKEKRKAVDAPDVSFWYVTNHLGRRFLKNARERLGPVESVGAGVWRGSILERPLFLISSVDLVVERDCLPLHILGVESPEKETAVARLVLEQEELLDLYAEFLASLHPEALKELQNMARTSKKGPKFHMKPLVELFGMEQIVDQLAKDPENRKRVLAQLLTHLSKSERTELAKKLEKS
jgi:hypothetical protein